MKHGRSRRAAWAAFVIGSVIALAATTAACSAGSVDPIDPGDPAATSSDTPTTSGPVVETKTVVETEVVPFATTSVDDPSRDAGTSAVTTAGANGVRTKTYSVTLTDGVETSRELVSDVVTTAPVDQVTSVGTRQQAPADCDPNYAGACVPIASDVDCAGGSGNGPAYVQGPVQVIGSDIYGLDRDGDGTACE